jgi:hypothetical protein
MTISYHDALTSKTLSQFTFGSGDAIPSIGDELVLNGEGGPKLLRVVRRRFVLDGDKPTGLEIVLDSATEVGRVGV